MDNITFLKKIRENAGLSQAKFAERFGIPVSTYEHWEMGVRKPPDYVIKMMTTILKNEEGKNNA